MVFAELHILYTSKKVMAVQAPGTVGLAEEVPPELAALVSAIQDLESVLPALDTQEQGAIRTPEQKMAFIQAQQKAYDSFNAAHKTYLITPPSVSEIKVYNSNVSRYITIVDRYFEACSSVTTDEDLSLAISIQESKDLIAETIKKQQQQEQIKEDAVLAAELQRIETALDKENPASVGLPTNVEAVTTIGDGNCLFNGLALSIVATLNAHSRSVHPVMTKINTLADTDENWASFRDALGTVIGQDNDMVQVSLQGPLRKLAVAAVKAKMGHDENFKKQVQHVYKVKTAKAYGEKLSKDASWGSYLEAREIADALEMDFHLYHPHGNDSPETRQVNGAIRLLNRSGVHWTAVVPKRRPSAAYGMDLV